MMGALGNDGGGKLGAARKLLEKMEAKTAPVSAPLPRTIKERQERKAGYEASSKDVTKWQPIVKVSAACCCLGTARGDCWRTCGGAVIHAWWMVLVAWGWCVAPCVLLWCAPRCMLAAGVWWSLLPVEACCAICTVEQG
jgi:hypothetical protein